MRQLVWPWHTKDQMATLMLRRVSLLISTIHVEDDQLAPESLFEGV